MRLQVLSLSCVLCFLLAGCRRGEPSKPAVEVTKGGGDQAVDKRVVKEGGGGTKGPLELPAEFLRLKLPPLRDVPTPKAEPRRRWWPGEPLKPVPTKDLPVAEIARGTVTPTEGGAVSLKSGAQVRIPPGSVAEPVTIEFLEIKPSGPDVGTSRLFRLEPDGLKFRTPATLVLPFEVNKVAKDAKLPVTLSVLHPTKGWERLPAEVDMSKGTVSAVIHHFSDYSSENRYWGNEFSIERPPVRLAVPYYSQGFYPWCALASHQMLLKYYGRDTEIWETASVFNASPSEGARQVFAPAYYQAMGFDVSMTYAGWRDPTDMTGWIQNMLRLNRPVRVGITRINHDFLVVGFDDQGVWINDPSGACIEDLRGGGALDDNRLGPVRLTWKEWFGPQPWINGKPVRGSPGGLLGTNSGPVYTLVITDGTPAKFPAAVTMTLLSGDEGLKFKIPRPANFPRDWFNKFTWDGTKPGGYEFGGAIPPVLIGLPKAVPTNSDTLHQFKVMLSNSTARPVTADLELLLAGKPLRSKKGIKLDAETTNTAVDLMESAPHDFAQQPLSLGTHDLIALLKVDGEIADRLSVRFVQGPSRPTGLKAVRTGDKVKLTWNPNPEPGLGLGGVHYVVWRDGKVAMWVQAPIFEDTLPAEDTSKHEYRVEAFDGRGTDLVSGYVSDPVTIPGAGPFLVRLSRIDYEIQKVTGTNSSGVPRDSVLEKKGNLTGATARIPVEYSATWETGFTQMTGNIEAAFPETLEVIRQPNGTNMAKGKVTIKANANWSNKGLGFGRPTGIWILSGQKSAKDDKGSFANGAIKATADLQEELDFLVPGNAARDAGELEVAGATVSIQGPQNRNVTLRAIYKLAGP